MMSNGRTEHMLAAFDKMEKKLAGVDDTVRGFYYSMRNSGKTSSYKTHEVYVNHIIKFMNDINKPVTDITIDDMNMYLAKSSIKKDGNPVSGSYLIAVYSALKKYFTYLYKNGKVKTNIMLNIDRPAPKPSDEVDRYFLTKKEIKQCLKKIDASSTKWRLRNKVITIIFLTTGIRCTALTEINVEDLNFEENTLKTIDKGNKFKEHYLTDEVMDLISEWLAQREKELEGYPQTNALFITKLRTRISQGAISDIVKTYAHVDGKKITPHKLRATFATQMLDAGCDIYTVQSMLNHSSPKTTELYAHLNNDKVRENAKKTSSFVRL